MNAGLNILNPELQPLADLIESLGREMHEGFQVMRDSFMSVQAQLDAIQARLDLRW